MPSDGARVYPVDYLLMHHSVGPVFENAEEQVVADWYDAIGRNRGYAGLAHSNHYDPRTGKETFAQAHYALHPYTLDGNKYGWKLTLMIADPFDNVAWHAGNWGVNQRSIGIETCGIYLDHGLPQEALMLVADTLRAHDRQLVADGYLDGLCVFGHRTFYATQCPGLIFDQVPTIIDMINNPNTWNGRLWPADYPDQAEWKNSLRDIDPLTLKMTRDVAFVNMLTGEVAKPVPAGEIVTVEYRTHQTGQDYYMTQFSVDKNKPVGIKGSDLFSGVEVVPGPQPQPQPQPNPIPVPGPVEPPTPPSSDETATIEQWMVDSYNFHKKWFEDHKEA